MMRKLIEEVNCLDGTFAISYIKFHPIANGFRIDSKSRLLYNTFITATNI